jgi:hypothetical protein
MITTIKVWGRNGEDLATFQSILHKNVIENVSLNDVKAFMSDTNRKNGNAMHYGQTLVVSVNETEKEIVLKKLKEIFRDLCKLKYYVKKRFNIAYKSHIFFGITLHNISILVLHFIKPI